MKILRTISWAFFAILAASSAFASETIQGGYSYKCSSAEVNADGQVTVRPDANDYSNFTVEKRGSKRTVTWRSNQGQFTFQSRDAEKTPVGKAYLAAAPGKNITYFEKKGRDSADQPVFVVRYAKGAGVVAIEQAEEMTEIRVEISNDHAIVTGRCGAGSMLLPKSEDPYALGKDVTDKVAAFMTNGIFTP